MLYEVITNMDRNEWFAEKATEIGFSELTFLNCRYSERKVIKNERIEKILISAMKQSLVITSYSIHYTKLYEVQLPPSHDLDHPHVRHIPAG